MKIGKDVERIFEIKVFLMKKKNDLKNHEKL